MRLAEATMDGALARLPVGWRGPLLSVVATRAMRGAVLWSALALLAGGWALLSDEPGTVALVYAALAVILTLTLSVGASMDRGTARWLLLFQAPVTPLVFYGRALVLRWSLACGLVLVLALAHTLVALLADVPFTRGALLAMGGVYAWTLILLTVLLAVGCACATWLSPPNVPAAIVGLILLSAVQGVLFTLMSVGDGAIRAVIRYLLLPLDGMGASAWLIGVPSSPPPLADLVHLALYPVAAVAIALLRLHTLARAELRQAEA